MLSRLARVVCAAVMLPLSGCTSYVVTRVTAFEHWNGFGADRSYAYSRAAEQQNNLEQRTYEHIVDDALAGYGFSRTDAARAHYLVSLSYDTRSQIEVVDRPVYYSAWPGPYGRAFGPWWGPPMLVPAYVPQAYTEFVYGLTLRIAERAGGAELYRVTATTAGQEPSLVRAMPYLVRSAFTDFPLRNGTVIQVRLPLEKRGAASSANEVTVPPPASAGAATSPAH